MAVYGVPTVRGEIVVDGEPLKGRAHVPTARSVSIVPQGKRIFANLSVAENIMLGRVSRRTTTWTTEDIYDLFPNLARAKRKPGTSLSGGEHQMLAIARGLMSGPALLMLDEPTEGLAPVIIDSITEALKKIRARGTALLLVEQHIGMIQNLADRFLALRTGLLVGSGPIAELSNREVQELIAL